MLSYRHAFHAGNPADVLKHSVLIHCLRHFLKKEKAFHYIDTHAGAGLYELTTGFSDKNREYLGGVAKLYQQSEELPAALRDYVAIVESFNNTTELEFYPGSPLIAKQLLRQMDQLRLHELHKADFEILYSHFAADTRALLQKKDGLRGMIKAFPPPSRRGLALIDPPYENKQDYVVLPYAIHDALVKFATGTVLVWYPMLEDGRFLELKEDLSKIPCNNWLNVEFQSRAASPGLFGSGLWVFNPPWDLPSVISDMETTLLTKLGEDSGAQLTCSFEIK